MKVLVIPFERHPSDHTFLEEMFTSSESPWDAVFLMRSREAIENCVRSWGKSRVYLFPEDPGAGLLREVSKYFMDLRYVANFIRLARRERPDVVLVRDLTFPLLLALVLRPMFGYKTLYQRSFPYEFSWFDPQRVQGYKFPALWKLCRSVESALLHRLLHEVDGILSISKYMKRELIESDMLDAARIHPFGMGIDLAAVRSVLASRGSAHSTDEVARFFYLGTLARARRMDHLLEAIADAATRNPTLLFHVDFLGGHESEIEDLSKLASELGVGERVSFLGRVPRSRLYETIADYDCGLVYIPADPRYWISCPTKLIECLSMGIPCIATNTAKTNLELAHQTGAVVVAGAEPREFAEGMLRFLRDREKFTDAALASRERIQADYDYDAMRESFAAICSDGLCEVKQP
jgi:glycosyltransferase involved in cell wall biosynthesis